MLMIKHDYSIYFDSFQRFLRIQSQKFGPRFFVGFFAHPVFSFMSHVSPIKIQNGRH